jgi:hypothetical protein
MQELDVDEILSRTNIFRSTRVYPIIYHTPLLLVHSSSSAAGTKGPSVAAYQDSRSHTQSQNLKKMYEAVDMQHSFPFLRRDSKRHDLFSFQICIIFPLFSHTKTGKAKDIQARCVTLLCRGIGR